MSEEPLRVCRAIVRDFRCDVHGDVIDVVDIERESGEQVARFCTLCIPQEPGKPRPWFYTGSPFGHEILSLMRAQ